MASSGARSALGGSLRPVSKAAAAYATLRKSIRVGDLEPGERVTLKRLSEHLGMSLTPVREALNRLESEGFVVHDPHRGTFIAELTVERIEQVYRLRCVLEPMAVRLAGERATSNDLARLHELVVACDEAGTPLETVESNEELHLAIYRLSGDALLAGFIDQLWAGMPYPSLGLYGSVSRVGQSSEEHHRIVDAMAEGRLDDAAEAMRVHIEHGREAALRNLRED
ncbi:FCD domain-containing protein [Nesterenkonia xinjiangensis]|uniref:DNA-binding GntR family transcriptional regulator n=1 Tax=Nesterenkonia xinjiangensis TaxID=225327 RepID=A0A7Z0KC10_9MICC|nr:DNA-binding GntR family transcriptional regulator [Nesterenkonia xinjiangensis]